MVSGKKNLLQVISAVTCLYLQGGLEAQAATVEFSGSCTSLGQSAADCGSSPEYLHLIIASTEDMTLEGVFDFTAWFAGHPVTLTVNGYAIPEYRTLLAGAFHPSQSLSFSAVWTESATPASTDWLANSTESGTVTFGLSAGINLAGYQPVWISGPANTGLLNGPSVITLLSPVPAPASVWLMLSGLTMIGVFLRRRITQNVPALHSREA